MSSMAKTIMPVEVVGVVLKMHNFPNRAPRQIGNVYIGTVVRFEHAPFHGSGALLRVIRSGGLERQRIDRIVQVGGIGTNGAESRRL